MFRHPEGSNARKYAPSLNIRCLWVASWNNQGLRYFKITLEHRLLNSFQVIIYITLYLWVKNNNWYFEHNHPPAAQSGLDNTMFNSPKIRLVTAHERVILWNSVQHILLRLWQTWRSLCLQSLVMMCWKFQMCLCESGQHPHVENQSTRTPISLYDQTPFLHIQMGYGMENSMVINKVTIANYVLPKCGALKSTKEWSTELITLLRGK